MKKLWKWMKKHVVFSAFAGSIVLSFLLMLIRMFSLSLPDYLRSPAHVLEDMLTLVYFGILMGILFIYPVVLTCQNLLAIFMEINPERLRIERRTGQITIVLGVVYSLLYDAFMEQIQFRSDWQEALRQTQLHTPIWTGAWLTVAVIACVAIAGYLLLSLRDINYIPPLVTVLSISAVYLGIALCALWIVQLFPLQKMLCLFPFNCILIAVRTVEKTVQEWQGSLENHGKTFSNKFLRRINEMLCRSSRWPLAAFVLMWPLLGILVAILILFGQQPDSIIKAWTETSDWTMSQRIAPPDLIYDEHYLCTVAAQGHPAVVKPLRGGIRHGHAVTVNRQLCIANAFEQILEERTPRLHRVIRRLYDRYGFPAARLIRTRLAADVVYFAMKPLEWCFLAVIYLTDARPENRIAVQYPHAPVPERR